MKSIRMSFLWSLILSFCLMTSHLPLLAIAQHFNEQSFNEEYDGILEDDSYVYLDDASHSIAEFIFVLSQCDNDVESPIHMLQRYIKNGFEVALRDEVLRVLGYAEWLLEQDSISVDDNRKNELYDVLYNLVDAIMQDSLLVDFDSFENDRRLPLLVINERIKVQGKAKFDSEAIFYKDVRFHDSARFYKRVHFKKGIRVNGTASIHNAVIDNLSAVDATIENLTLSGGIAITDLTLNSLTATDAVVDNLQVNNCIPHLCVQDLSVVDGSVSGTLSINDAVIQTLDLAGGLTVNDLTLHSLTATDAVVDNLQVNNCIPHLCVQDLSVVDGSISGTLSINDAVIQALDLTGGLTVNDLTLNSLTVTDAVVDNLQVNNCIPHLCVQDLSVVDGSVSGTLSINDAVIQTLDLTGGLVVTDLTLNSLTATDAVVDNLQVNNCIPHLCVQDLSVVDGSVSGTLSIADAVIQTLNVPSGNVTVATASIADAVINNLQVNTCIPELCVTRGSLTDLAVTGSLSVSDAFIEHLDIAQNTLQFLDSSNVNFVGMTAPLTVPTSYTVNLPPNVPTAQQFLRANVTTPTNLEWATTGGSLPPSISQIIYVTQYGNDATGDGSFDAPYATLLKAVDVANGIASLASPVVIFIGPGTYVEDNSVAPITVNAQGISIIGDSTTAVFIAPTTLSNNLLLINQTVTMNNVTCVALGTSTAAGIYFAGGQLANINDLHVFNFQSGIICAAGATGSFAFNNCLFADNGTALVINDTIVECNACTFLGTGSLSGTPVNAGVSISGANATVIIDSGSCVFCQSGFEISNNASLSVSATVFKINIFDIIVSTAAHTTLTGCSFELTNSASDIDLQMSGAGTSVYLIGCEFSGSSLVGVPEATGIMISDNAFVEIDGGTLNNYTTGIVVGLPSDAASTILSSSAFSIRNCTTDIQQQGSTTLNFNAGTASNSKIIINDPTNVSLSFFDLEDNNALTIGSTANKNTDLIDIAIGSGNDPKITYLSSLYSAQAVGFENPSTNPTTLFVASNNNADVAAITTNRADTAGVRLMSDTAVPVGGTSSLRGWDVYKNGTTAELIFRYQNSDPFLLGTVLPYTVMELDGENNKVQLPTTGTQIVFAGDTNLYRSSTSVLKTDNNFIVGTLTPNRVVVTDPITNELQSSIVTDTELSFLSGVTSSIQTQLNNKVSRSGDTMTGTLQLPAGTTALPALTFTGSTTTGLSANTGNLSFSTNGTEQMKISSGGTISVDGFTAAGIVHNDATGNLSSSLITNSDISPAAAIADSKLATISTAGKVANSATTATSANVPSAIVLRDTSGNFSAGIITASLNGNAATATSTSGFTGPLSGDVTGTQSATVVSFVGGKTAADVANATNIVDTATNLNTPNSLVWRDTTGSFAAQTISLVDEVATGSITVTPFTSSGVVHNNASGLLSSSLIVNADVSPTAAIVDTKLATISTAGKVLNSATTATSGNTANAIVARDASGNFSAGTITASLNGNAATATTAGSFSGSLAGDVTGTQSATVVSFVGGKTAADVANATATVDAATNTNVANTLVKRDGTGSFAAQAVSMVDAVVTGLATITPFNAAGVVHNDASGNLSSSLIVNADISGSAAIADTKLATISTAGKVANSATTATSANIANTIVERDASGNFTATTITANLTGSASNNVLKAGDTMTGTLTMATQNQIDFQDSGGVNFVGINAPTSVPTSYTMSLPSTIPTIGQTLRAGAVTPTNLEWVTEGGSVVPVVSRTVYVAKYGNDATGDGSFDLPYATLAKGVNVANGLSTVSNPVTIVMEPGVYVEDNSAGPITITAQGIAIMGDSPTSVTILPNTLSNDLLLINQPIVLSNIGFAVGGVSTASAINVTSGSLSEFINIRVLGFQVGVTCSGGMFDNYNFDNCFFIGNGTGLIDNGTVIACYNCSFIGNPSLLSPANTGISIQGTGAFAIIDGGVCGLCQTGLTLSNNAAAIVSSILFEFHTFGVVQTTGSQLTMSGCSFQFTSSPSDIDIQISGAGTKAQITGCKLDGNGGLGTPQATGLQVSNSAVVNINGGEIANFTTGILLGVPADTASTTLTASSFAIRNCTTDIQQQGSASLNFNAGTASGSKIVVNSPTNVSLAFFDLESNSALTIGSTADMNTTLLQAEISTTMQLNVDYKSSLYGAQAIGIDTDFANPTSLYVVAQNNADLVAVTTLRTDTAGVRLVSDTASPVGGITALRGWDINKNGSSAELSFKYQNSDVSGQSVIPQYTVMQLDGVNNQLQLPTAGTQILFAGDTNLYRSSASVLKTDDNLIVGTLTPGRVVQTDGVTNQLESSVVTNTELGYVSGVTSSIQTQLNGKVSKSGDIMTGTLQLPAGTTALPALTFTGSTTTGLSASSNNLSLSANGAEVMKLSSTGVVSIDGFAGAAGVVHNDSLGNLSSSLIVNADITNATISNAKLATISSSNTAGAIVVRDGSGNFATNMVTLLGSVTNPTDAATKAYVDSAVSTGLVVKTPALVASTTNITLSGLQTIDGVALSANDRVLLVGQTNPVENGLWLAQAGAWTRPTDFANGTAAGEAYVLVTSGATYEGASWVCNTPTAIIGTNPLSFEQFSLPNTTTAANIGAGTGLIFANKTGVTLNLRSLIAGTHLTYTTNTSDITLTTDATNANTASTLVARDSSGNFSAGTITASLTGSASNNVLKAGDTMTGSLTLPVGTALAPSLNFTGSTTTGLSVPSANTLSFSTNGSQAMSISSAGVVAINDLTPTAGVVHNDASGNLSSSLIINADISNSAAITDSKLATISTAGKVANSATTATSSNTANAIVARDASGNFTAGIISATLNGSATNNVLKAGDTMTGTLQLPAGTTALPSLVFTGSTTTGLSANTGNLSFSTNGVEQMKISSSGTISVDNFTVAGIVHNDASGNLSSSLIVNTDVSPTAAITDSKLATITTAGKVANSATSATSVNTPSTIVLRDASGNFSAGTITASLNGNATTATTATNFSGSLAGDVTGTQSATVVSFVGGKTAADVASATATVDAATNTNVANTLIKRDGTGSFAVQTISVVDEVATNSITVTPFTSSGVVHNNASGLLSSSLIVNADVSPTAAITDSKLATISTAGKVLNSATTATSGNTANAIVARDASGNFSAGTITANLSGNATTATTATNFSGSLAGDVTGTQSATVVSFVGGQSAANVAAATIAANAATNLNTASTIVKRDGTGSFAAQAVSMVDAVVTGLATITPFNAVGVVHNDASGNLSSSLIVNADISGSAAITDSKLATISTAGKVANSATTATSANTPNAIVARDASGNFTATTITANLTGSASNNVLKAGDTMTGTLTMATQNQIKFQDAGGVNYVGINAPSAVPTSYTLSLPPSVPIASQTLRAGSITPTNLEWVTEGGSITPATSRTIYVTQYGNDVTGNGSFDLPYASLAKAVGVANSLSTTANPIAIAMAPGTYTENNSAGPISITAQGISIVGDSPTAVIIMPSTLSNDLLLINQTVAISGISFVAGGTSTATGISFANGPLSELARVHIVNFKTGISCSGGPTSAYEFNDCFFINNNTGMSVNASGAQCYNCSFLGSSSFVTPTNTGLSVTGAGAVVIVDGGGCSVCATGFVVSNSAALNCNAVDFEFNMFDVVQSTSSQLILSACIFQYTVGSSDIKVQSSGSGTNAQIIGCDFDGNSSLGVAQGTGIVVSNNANIGISGGRMVNYTTGLQSGISTDTASTTLLASSFVIRNCTTDIQQQGSSTLHVGASTLSSSAVSINNATNVSMAFFDIGDNNALIIGSSANVNTTLLQPYIDPVNHPSIEYLSSLYSTQAVGFQNLFGNPSTLLVEANANADLAAITTLRTDTAGVRLVSDTGSPVGGTSALRGWDMIKNGSSAQLAFNYQNSDAVGQSVIPQYTVMQLDGVNNQLQLPTAATQILFAGDTNLYRSSANVLKTDSNVIVGTLTPNRVVMTDPVTNQLESSVVTDTELSFVSGVTSSIQTQLNNKVSRSGDTMTGTLQLPAGSTAAPSLVFTGSTTTGLSANTGSLSFSTNGIEQMKISSGGTISVDGFTVAGIVHNDASGNLSSSLIVNSDISATAAITDSKLATISTAGKVANSATTATSANTANAIVSRDASGNFSTNEITIAGTVTNPTDAATKAYVDSSVGVIGTNLNTPNTLVKRDGTGSFAAQNISMVEGLVSGFISLPTTSSLSVGTVQQNGNSFIHSFGTNSTFVGQSAGNFTMSGTGANTAIGASSLAANTTGSNNTAIGKNALTANTTGANNTAVGVNAGVAVTTGANNVMVGANIAASTTTGSNNIYIDGNSLTPGNENNTIRIGNTQSTCFIQGIYGISITSPQVATVNSLGQLGSATAVSLGTSLNTPSTLVARDSSGNFSAGTITASLSGNATTATTATNFSGSLSGDVTGTQSATVVSLVGGVTAANVASGANAANAATNLDTANTIVKRDASGSFAATNISMVDGIASGFISIPTTASLSVGTIQQNGSSLLHTFGTNNTFVGKSAGNFTMTGIGSNTAVGASSFASNTTGINNTAVGSFALNGNTTGSNSTAVGVNALLSNSTGTGNTAVGASALSANTTGTQNTTLGVGAGSAITSGNNNIMIGYNVGLSTTTGSNNLYIGSNGLSPANESNTLRIGTGQTSAYMLGIFGVSLTSPQVVTVVSGGQLGSATAVSLGTSANTASTLVARDSSGNFSAGTITASLNGNATTATSAGSFSGSLAGDVTGTQSATVVSLVGGVTAANVASGANAANAATNLNTASTIVKRDASGNFSAGTITANLTGNVTGNLSGNATTATTATSFSGSLSGDVTGTQSATVVSLVGGVTAANVASGANAANAATSANIANAIVARDASGNFSTNEITISGTVTNPTDAATKAYVDSVAGSPGTPSNIDNTTVKRDGTGSFSAQVVSVVDVVASTLITAAAGSAASPSINFTGSTNTGFSAATANTLSFDTNGVERMSISATNIIDSVPYCNQAILVNTTLSTGGTVTTNATTSILLIDAGGTVNGCTITFPPNPTNGQYFTIISVSTHAINSITNTGGTGAATIVNPITALSPSASITTTTGGVSVTYVYYSTNNAWYRMTRG